ncbi:Hypothetical predicted protein [Olea europaea subsp. europaea]|uniref:Uncharacterized protein n=1 Tax=Olea europaea subsp. europaea TaxID=158383 RepID=A0A8S0VPU5_OLEEU|nr:Hypothetical predicted protein [Olea europaea subsp. europaea]
MMNVYQENKDYREFRDKDCSEVYSYKVLFGDAYDSDKYAVTPSTMCRTGFSLFEDSRHEDLQDSHPVDEEGSGSSDEGERMDPVESSMDVLRPRSGDKRTHGGRNKKEKRGKMSVTDLLDSVHLASTVSAKIAAKINSLVGPNVSDANTLMKELLSTGRLKKKTDMEIPAMQEDANDKLDWVE